MIIMFLCVYCIPLIVFFFFKQKTAYEMRISDWSSDVCSSDLRQLEGIIMTYFHRAALAASAALALSCLVPATAHAQLKPGDSASAFTLDATLAGKAFPFSLMEDFR